MDLKIASEREWSKLEKNSQHGTIFHTWKWLKIIEKHTKSELYPVIGAKGTTPIGIYPLFYLKNFFFRSVFSPPPWVSVPYLGPVIVDYNEMKQDKKESIFIEFQRKVDEFILSELKPHYILINSLPDLLDARPFKWSDYNVEPLYNYIIDLSKGEDYIWKQFKRNLRQKINKAIKNGICIETGSKEELIWILNALADRYEEQSKVISLSKEYVLDLYNDFYPQNMKIFVAKYNSEIVGGMIDIHYKGKVVSWLGSVKVNIEGISPNELLQWEAIKYAGEQGMNYYVEVGANTEHLCEYKSKYNPDLYLYFSAKKSSSALSKLAEVAYFKMLKPVRTRLNMHKGL